MNGAAPRVSALTRASSGPSSVATSSRSDRLRDVSLTGARVATEALAKEGDELRFELLDDEGVRFATGFARVAWVDAVRGMGIAFLALGIDREVVATLFGAGRSRRRGRAEASAAAAPAAAGTAPCRRGSRRFILRRAGAPRSSRSASAAPAA